MDTQITKLKLLRTRPEAGNAKTFVFERDGLDWVAGQYQKYVLPQAGSERKDNQRFFTISSAPTEKTINISTRVSDSAFKTVLNKLQPGDTIETYGPEGDFVWDKETKRPIVLVAAGIGVTPYRSMLLERAASKLPLNAALIYFNRDDEIPFLDEFKKLAAEHSEFKLLPIVGERVSAERILELAPQAKDGTLYLSGPEPMVETIGEELKKKGVILKQDWFPGYTAENF